MAAPAPTASPLIAPATPVTVLSPADAVAPATPVTVLSPALAVLSPTVAAAPSQPPITPAVLPPALLPPSAMTASRFGSRTRCWDSLSSSSVGLMSSNTYHVIRVNRQGE